MGFGIGIGISPLLGFDIGGGAPSFDPDAQAFITAASITDPTQESAINTLVTDLKGYSIWTKMKAVYPFVGGTASTHKYNLKDPRDLDAAFRLVFSGGLTHSSTGVVSDGINGYYTTKFNDSINGSQNNQAIGVYIRYNLNGTSATQDFGTEFASGSLIQIYSKVDNGGNQEYGTRHHDSTYSGVLNSDSRGFYSISRTSSASYLKQKNNTISTVSVASTGTQNAEILGFKNTTIYSPREQAFAYISDGLTNAEMTNLYTAVQAFQTTLSRNV